MCKLFIFLTHNIEHRKGSQNSDSERSQRILSKPKNQSESITYQAKTIEEPNIIDQESVTIYHPKLLLNYESLLNNQKL